MRFDSGILSLRLLAMLSIAATGACGGKSKSSPASPSPTTPAPDPTGSTVSDPVAQSSVVSLQLSTAVQALSDGGTGASGGGGGGAGLDGADLTEPSFAQTCAAAPLAADLALTSPDGALSWTVKAKTPVATLTHTYAGGNAFLSFNTNADGTPSGDSEVWYPGPYFGLANIAPDPVPAGATWGTLAKGSAVPAPTPAAGAPKASSGTVGSVGFRSRDGSWTGAPVWEVGPHYVGWLNSAVVPAAKTLGMTMYATLPAVTAAAPAPTVGGAYTPLQMVGPDYAGIGTPKARELLFLTLGEADANGVLPSFTATGSAVVQGAAVAVGQAGTVTAAGLPGRIYNPPAALSCDTAATANAWPVPGWRFSQNVAGLTRISTSQTNVARTYAKGTAVVTHKGTRTITFADPATVPPGTSTPPAPFFDENAGRLSLTHSMAIGTQASPNSTTVIYTPNVGPAKPQIRTTLYTSAPFMVTTTRNLGDGGWAWATKTVQSGVLNTATFVGAEAVASANVATQFAQVVFENNSDKALACVPKSGTITAAITPVDATLATTTYTLRFNASVTAGVNAPSGVTVQVACSGGGAAAANCTPAAETDDPDYKPTGCNF